MFYISPVVRNLLILNVAIFFIQVLLPFGAVLSDFMMLKSPFTFLENGEVGYDPSFSPLQLITYMFIHANGSHLFSNMLGLFFFGSAIEGFMGSKKFLMYYLITGIGAALIHFVITFFQGENSILLGASGAVFGVLVAYGYLFPNHEIIMFPIFFPVKAKYLITFYGLYEIFSGVNNAGSNVAHFAHVGGLVVGLILLRFFKFSKQTR